MLTPKQIIEKRRQLNNPQYRANCFRTINSKQLNRLLKDVARGKVIYPIKGINK